MRTKVSILAVLAVVLLAGCARQANVFPTSGPMAEAGQIQPVKMIFHGLATTGECDVTLPTGELCKGNYSMALNQAQVWGVGGGVAQWQHVWGQVWGANYQSRVYSAGLQYGMASLAGDKGTILEIQFVMGNMDGHGFGVAKDNRGNFFKLYL